MRAIAIGIFLVAAARLAGATVFAPLDDATLTASSDVIVTGTVTGVEGVESSGRIVTRSRIAVDQVLKGVVDGTTVTVTTPGGHAGDRWAVIFGAPAFRVGDAVLAFLQRDARGELRPNALALGVYWLTSGTDGATLAERRVTVPEVRPLASFAAALGAAVGTVPLPRATVTLPAPTPEIERFTFLGPPFARWFEPDSGQTVRYKVANADASLGAAVSNTIIDAAFAAWTAVPTATIALARATGPAQASAVSTCDGRSTIQFNDPFGDISPLQNCHGVLAIGGFCVGTSTKVVNGVQFRRISEGDLTVADGVANCLDRLGFEEIVTHEVGHTIGLGHSSEDPNEPNPTLRSATMYFLAHLDGRGASLRSDDIAGVTAIYPSFVDPNDLDGDGVANAVDVCPSTPPDTAVDATGCGCGEVGHAVCNDGRTCTTDACDGSTGRCLTTPTDCTGGNPCVAGSCDETNGCQTRPVDGDAAATCVFAGGFPPAACASERVPPKVSRLFSTAARTAGRAVPNGNTRLAARSVRALARALVAVDRAAARRRRPLAGACAATLEALLSDAQSRLLDWIDRR